MAEAPDYCEFCRSKPCKIEGTVSPHPKHTPLHIHCEFHRLVTALQDSVQRISWAKAEDDDYGDAYAELSQRRKELYEWVAEQTPRPSPLYTIQLKF